MRTDVTLLADVFEKFIKVSIEEFDINPLYCISPPSYTYQCGVEYTRNKLQTLQDKDMFLLLQNNIRGCICSVLGDKYVKSNEPKKTIYSMLIFIWTLQVSTICI